MIEKSTQINTIAPLTLFPGPKSFKDLFDCFHIEVMLFHHCVLPPDDKCALNEACQNAPVTIHFIFPVFNFFNLYHSRHAAGMCFF